MAQEIVIAVDTKERTPDALALGRLLAVATGAPARLVTVSADAPLEDAGRLLAELADHAGLPEAAVEVIPGNLAAHELQEVSERDATALLVVGSTTRGPVGRLLVGGVGERLLAGSAAPVAIAPRGYAASAPGRLARIGVGFDGSDEALRALEAAIALAGSAGAELRVVTAYRPVAFGTVAVAALPSASANEVMRSDLLAVNDAAVATARDAVPAEGWFVDGPPQAVLRDESAGVDLLIAGSRGRGPLGAVLLGSVTASLVRDAASPLLITPRGTRFALDGVQARWAAGSTSRRLGA